jgi:DNA-directed RNA polymerase subunit M/transcription elongation factor TFIIS
MSNTATDREEKVAVQCIECKSRNCAGMRLRSHITEIFKTEFRIRCLDCGRKWRKWVEEIV